MEQHTPNENTHSCPFVEPNYNVNTGDKLLHVRLAVLTITTCLHASNLDPLPMLSQLKCNCFRPSDNDTETSAHCYVWGLHGKAAVMLSYNPVYSYNITKLPYSPPLPYILNSIACSHTLSIYMCILLYTAS